MFLREIVESGVPDLDVIDSQKLRKWFIYRVKLRQDLRNRFRNEYLGLLKSYAKSAKESSIIVGDLVLRGDNAVKRINWPLAKVLRTVPERDGKVWILEVKILSGKFLRPIQQIYPVEILYNSKPHNVNDKDSVVTYHLSFPLWTITVDSSKCPFQSPPTQRWEDVTNSKLLVIEHLNFQ